MGRRGRDGIIRYTEMWGVFGAKFLYEFIRRLEIILQSVEQNMHIAPCTLDISLSYDNNILNVTLNTVNRSMFDPEFRVDGTLFIS